MGLYKRKANDKINSRLMKHVNIEIENLKCRGCASTITKGLNKFDGVENVDVDVEKSTVAISFQGEGTNIDRYKKKLAHLGYPEKGNNTTISVAKSYVSCAIGRISKSIIN